MQDVIFMRKYPVSLSISRWKGFSENLRSVFGSGGTENLFKKRVTFFFPGYSYHLRSIPTEIVEQINSGAISDVVDFGAAGALDPSLRFGDLVLSQGEVCCDGTEISNQKSRPHTEAVVRRIAEGSGRGFSKGKILTAPKIVSKRSERLRLYEHTGAKVVQMEHCWFIQKLRKLVDPKAFSELHFTHIELVSDEVPNRESSVAETIFSVWRALDVCIFRNDRHLGKLRTRFLFEFLSPYA